LFVDGRPQYPAEEEEKVEIFDDCDNVLSECDDFSITVSLFSLCHFTFTSFSTISCAVCLYKVGMTEQKMV